MPHEVVKRKDELLSPQLLFSLFSVTSPCPYTLNLPYSYHARISPSLLSPRLFCVNFNDLWHGRVLPLD